MNQEERERFYLGKFLDALAFSCQKIDRGADPPDFVIHSSGAKIAIEITEFYSDAKGATGDPRQLVEREWDKLRDVIAKAREQYPELKEINCHILFMELGVPSRRDHQKFADELVGFVIKNLAMLTEESQDFKILSNDFPLLKKYVAKIRLNKAGCYITWDWNHSVGFVGLSEDELSGVISRKTGQDNSENSCSETWLLIIGDGGEGISQSMGLPHIDELNSFGTVNGILGGSSFDRVYIFQYLLDRIFEWRRGRGWLLVRDRER
ncbi:MAG: hypothetical protein PHS61_03395 [Candidatus Omnitrophica bacterium]|nr:hypothetical protein [Candidatus Omnitrophota bacterium]